MISGLGAVIRWIEIFPGGGGGGDAESCRMDCFGGARRGMKTREREI